jgi:hypothetical protein
MIIILIFALFVPWRLVILDQTHINITNQYLLKMNFIQISKVSIENIYYFKRSAKCNSISQIIQAVRS